MVLIATLCLVPIIFTIFFLRRYICRKIQGFGRKKNDKKVEYGNDGNTNQIQTEDKKFKENTSSSKNTSKRIDPVCNVQFKNDIEIQQIETEDNNSKENASLNKNASLSDENRAEAKIKPIIKDGESQILDTKKGNNSNNKNELTKNVSYKNTTSEKEKDKTQNITAHNSKTDTKEEKKNKQSFKKGKPNRRKGTPKTNLSHDSPGNVTKVFKPKGFPNLGNTSYMNAIVQNLVWTPLIERKLSKSDKNIVETALYKVVHATHNDPGETVNQNIILAVLNAARKHNDQFCGSHQQDSFEMYNTLVGGIQDEKLKQKPFKTKGGSKVSELEHTMDTCPLTRLFGGMFMTVYYYESCEHVELNFQMFTSICVPVPKEKTVTKNTLQKHTSNKIVKEELLIDLHGEEQSQENSTATSVARDEGTYKRWFQLDDQSDKRHSKGEQTIQRNIHKAKNNSKDGIKDTEKDVIIRSDNNGNSGCKHENRGNQAHSSDGKVKDEENQDCPEHLTASSEEEKQNVSKPPTSSDNNGHFSEIQDIPENKTQENVNLKLKNEVQIDIEHISDDTANASSKNDQMKSKKEEGKAEHDDKQVGPKESIALLGKVEKGEEVADDVKQQDEKFQVIQEHPSTHSKNEEQHAYNSENSLDRTLAANENLQDKSQEIFKDVSIRSDKNGNSEGKNENQGNQSHSSDGKVKDEENQDYPEHLTASSEEEKQNISKPPTSSDNNGHFSEIQDISENKTQENVNSKLKNEVQINIEHISDDTANASSKNEEMKIKQEEGKAEHDDKKVGPKKSITLLGKVEKGEKIADDLKKEDEIFQVIQEHSSTHSEKKGQHADNLENSFDRNSAANERLQDKRQEIFKDATIRSDNNGSSGGKHENQGNQAHSSDGKVKDEEKQVCAEHLPASSKEEKQNISKPPTSSDNNGHFSEIQDIPENKTQENVNSKLKNEVQIDIEHKSDDIANASSTTDQLKTKQEDGKAAHDDKQVCPKESIALLGKVEKGEEVADDVKQQDEIFQVIQEHPSTHSKNEEQHAYNSENSLDRTLAANENLQDKSQEIFKDVSIRSDKNGNSEGKNENQGNQSHSSDGKVKDEENQVFAEHLLASSKEKKQNISKPPTSSDNNGHFSEIQDIPENKTQENVNSKFKNEVQIDIEHISDDTANASSKNEEMKIKQEEGKAEHDNKQEGPKESIALLGKVEKGEEIADDVKQQDEIFQVIQEHSSTHSENEGQHADNSGNSFDRTSAANERQKEQNQSILEHVMTSSDNIGNNEEKYENQENITHSSRLSDGKVNDEENQESSKHLNLTCKNEVQIKINSVSEDYGNVSSRSVQTENKQETGEKDSGEKQVGPEISTVLSENVEKCEDVVQEVQQQSDTFQNIQIHSSTKSENERQNAENPNTLLEIGGDPDHKRGNVTSVQNDVDFFTFLPKSKLDIASMKPLQGAITDGKLTGIENGLFELTGIEEFEEEILPCTECSAKDPDYYSFGKTLKKLFVITPPPVLVLQINRFMQEYRDLRKINKKVSYPETLNISTYLSAAYKVTEERLESEKILYNLYGVVAHSGSLGGGHYVAYVKTSKRDPEKLWQKFMNNRDFKDVEHVYGTKILDFFKNESQSDKTAENHSDREPRSSNENQFDGGCKDNDSVWYYISDSMVTLSSKEDVHKISNAYVLFYERIQ